MCKVTIFTARVRSTTGRYCFHTCVSVKGGGLPQSLIPGPFPASGPMSYLLGGGGGLPQSLVPGPFPASGPMSFPEGVSPSPVTGPV